MAAAAWPCSRPGHNSGHQVSPNGICKMSIDTSGKWWGGSDASDIREYLEAYAEGDYGVHDFRLAKCRCGSDRFYVDIDGDEGVVKRTCPNCSFERFVCDSDEYLEDAAPRRWRCTECRSHETNLGVGFSLRDDGEVRWIHVGCRCARCGVLGCVAEWKIDTQLSRQLLEKV